MVDKYADKGLQLQADTHSVVAQFEDTSFYSCVSKTKCFIVSICSVVALILASVSYSLLNSDIELVQQTFNDWNLQPIQDIQVNPQGLLCPDGTQLAWNQKWAGMSNGCYCHSGYLSTGSCSKKERKRGCYDVSGTPSKQYHTFNENMICIKRSSTAPAIVRAQTTTKKQCDIGYKACGSSTKDNAQRYCVEEGQTCPINQMRIVSDDDKAKLNGYSKVISLKNGYKLGIRNDGAALPISEIKISQGVPCLNQNQYNRTPGKPTYKLQNQFQDCSSYNGYKQDNRWNQISQTSDYKLLLDNNIWNLMQSKPGFNLTPQQRSQKQKLYYRTYIPWNPLCRAGGQQISRAKIIEDSNNFSSSVSSYQIGLIILSALFVAFGILTLVMACIRKCAPFSQIYILLIKGVVIIFCGIMMTLYIKANLIIGDNEEPYKQMMSAKCSDNLTNSLLSQLPEQIETTKKVNYVGGVFCAFLVLWQVLIYFVSWSKYGKPI